MVKKQLFSARRGLAIIVALSMVMSHGVIALADEDDPTTGEVTVEATTKDDSDTNNTSASSTDGGAAVTASSSDGNTATVEVSGDVTSTGKGDSNQSDWANTGIEASSSGEGSSTKVDVEGDVTVEREGTSRGIAVEGNSDVDIHVGGSVTSDGGTEGTAYGIADYAGEGSDVTVNVDSNVIATGKFVEAVQLEGAGGKHEITVGGNVEEHSKPIETEFETEGGGHAIGLGDGSNATSDIDVTVKGNVIANDTAVEIMKYSDNSKIDLVVEGTIEGGKHNIVIDTLQDIDYSTGTVTETIDPKVSNLNITVWKIDTSNTKGKIVENKVGGEYKQDEITEKVEENINYIIKIDEKSTNYLSPDKKTAKQDDTVILKLNVPSGYAVDSFYNGKDAANVNVLQDSSGNYYLVVPRGGGVYVGVNLRETGSGSSTTGDNTISVSVVEGSRTESGASDGEYWSPSSNNQANALGGVFSGYETLQALQIPSAIYGGPDMFVNVADVLTPVDTITAMNSFTGTDLASINMNNVMGAGIVDFKNMFVNASSNTVEVPVPANVVANQSYTVMFSDGTSMVVPCAMNGVLSIPFSKTAEGLTYIICGIQLDPSMFIGMPPATGWTY